MQASYWRLHRLERRSCLPGCFRQAATTSQSYSLTYQQKCFVVNVVDGSASMKSRQRQDRTAGRLCAKTCKPLFGGERLVLLSNQDLASYPTLFVQITLTSPLDP